MKVPENIPDPLYGDRLPVGVFHCFRYTTERRGRGFMQTNSPETNKAAEKVAYLAQAATTGATRSFEKTAIG
jgi:hypothetical protein